MREDRKGVVRSMVMNYLAQQHIVKTINGSPATLSLKQYLESLKLNQAEVKYGLHFATKVDQKELS